MKRRRGPSLLPADEAAERRVQRILERLVDLDAPVWAGRYRRPHEELRPLRELAERRAEGAGRAEMLAGARERVAMAYALRLGDAGRWTGIFAVPIAGSARDRAESQLVLRDLVTAAVVEDLLPLSAVARLRADGDWLLEPTPDVDPDDSGPQVHTPPEEPFAGPLIATRGQYRIVAVAIVALTLGFMVAYLALDPDDEAILVLVTAAVSTILLLALWRLWEVPRRG